MARVRTHFVCSSCGATTPRWMGRCPSCEQWDTLIEEKLEPAGARTPSSSSPTTAAVLLSTGQVTAPPRIPTGLAELDRLLGGGLVRGSLLLLGGEPGVGKSTLLLTVAGRLCSAGVRTLYVSGEESLPQIEMRAQRIGLTGAPLWLLAETRLPAIQSAARELNAELLILDSVQTTVSEELVSAAGTVGQVREVAGVMQTLAKQSGCVVWLVGHVTKEGALAGPKVLEHIVDVVVTFEGEGRHPYRVLRAEKNRFGATHEVALFEMKEEGLLPVSNPSERLLRERPLDAPGTAVTATWEGSRPLLVEIQALAARSGGGSPRRAALGVDPSRVNLLAAVLEKAGHPLYDRDLFVNAVGGIRITEPAADLAMAVAITSSLVGRPVPADLLVVGEVGLTGEVRGVSQLEARLAEGARHGFKRALLPLRAGTAPVSGLEPISVRTLAQALELALF